MIQIGGSGVNETNQARTEPNDHLMTHPHYDALLMDYAAGAASEAEALLLETHASLDGDARAQLAAAEAVGGALLESLPPAGMRAALLPTARAANAQVRARRARERRAAARSIVRRALRGERDLAWRWRPGLRECWLPVEGASLLMIPAGASMPRHRHGGEEVTLVLRGAYADEHGFYEAGAVAFADAGVEHAPRVVGRDDCLCLTATRGRLLFSCPITRAASWLLK